MKQRVILYLVCFLLVSCGEHSGKTIINFTGDYRYVNGIAEFFDCKSHVRYYLSKKGIPKTLEKEFQKLEVVDEHDAYVQVKGYLQEEQEMEGIDPALVFVPVELIGFDKSRGCDRGIRKGY